MQTVQAYRDIALQSLTTGALDSARVALIDDEFVWSFNMTLADINLTVAAGLAAKILTAWSAPYVVDGNRMRVTAGQLTFIAGAITVPLTIFGWALLDDTGAVLYGVERLDPPVAINLPGDAALVSVQFEWGN